MKKVFEDNLILLTLLTVFFLNISFSYANMVWPSLYIVNGLVKYYVILLNFFITYLVLRIIVKDEPKSAILALSIVFTILISFAGIFVIPICGFIAEVIFSFLKFATFGPIGWLLEIITSVAFYALLDSSILKLAFKISTKKTYLPLFLYNLITIGLATIEVLLIHPQSVMY